MGSFGFARVRSDGLSYGVVLVLGALGVLSLFQGVVDVALPMSRGGRPFAFTFALADRFGPGLLYASILVHNLGLAAMMPGIGYLAALLEPSVRARRLIPRILFLALLASMGTAFTYMFVGAGAFDLRFSLPLFLAEATAVMGVALVSYDQFPRHFGHDGPVTRATVARAFESVAVPVFVVALAVIALAVLETHAVLVGA